MAAVGIAAARLLIPPHTNIMANVIHEGTQILTLDERTSDQPKLEDAFRSLMNKTPVTPDMILEWIRSN